MKTTVKTIKCREYIHTYTDHFILWWFDATYEIWNEYNPCTRGDGTKCKLIAVDDISDNGFIDYAMQYLNITGHLDMYLIEKTPEYLEGEQDISGLYQKSAWYDFRKFSVICNIEHIKKDTIEIPLPLGWEETSSNITRFRKQDIGKYCSGITFYAYEPIIKWIEAKRADFGLAAGDFEYVTGYYKKTHDGNVVFDISIYGSHVLIRDGFNGNKDDGREIEKLPYLYYKRSCSNSRNSGIEYVVMEIRQFEQVRELYKKIDQGSNS